MPLDNNNCLVGAVYRPPNVSETTFAQIPASLKPSNRLNHQLLLFMSDFNSPDACSHDLVCSARSEATSWVIFIGVLNWVAISV